MSTRNGQIVQLRLSSRDRTNPTTTGPDNCTIKLARPQNIMSAYVTAASIPNAIPNICTENANTTLQTSLGNITVAEGEYTGTSLAAAVQTALIALDATFTCVFNSVNQKFTIARGAGVFTLPFSSSPSATSMATTLGYTVTDHVAAATYTSDNVAELTGTPWLYLVSRTLSAGAPPPILPLASPLTECIARIPVLSTYGGTSQWSADIPDLDILYSSNTATLDLVDIAFINHLGNAVSFRGREWTIDIAVRATEKTRGA